MKLSKLKLFNTNSITEFQSMMFRLVFSYALFLTLSLILIAFLYQNRMKNAEEKFWIQNKTVLQSSQSLMDNHLIIIDSYCRQLIQDSSFTATVAMKNSDQSNFYINAFKSKGSLPAQLYSYPQLPINSFYIYLRNYDYVLSVNKFEQAELYYLHVLKGSGYSVEQWQSQMINYSGDGTFFITESDSSTTRELQYSYLIDLSSLTYKNIPATVCFRFESQRLQDIFAGLPLLDTGYLMITDNADQEIVTFSNSDQAKPDSTLLSNLEYDATFSRFQTAEGSFFVTKLSSSFNQWNYYLVQPAAVCETSFQAYRFVFVLFMVLLLIASVIVILHLSKKHMRPVLLLNSRLLETITAHNQLQEIVDFQKPYICNSYLRHLMLGNITNEHEISYIQDYLQLQNEQLNFVVLYVMYYTTNDFCSTQPEHEINALVHSFLLDEFNGYTIPYLYSPDERAGALLLYSTQPPDDLLIVIQEKFFHLHERLLEQHSIWLFTGVGLSYHSLDQIWKSYEQAKEMISYSSKNYIFLLYEMKERDQHTFYYPEEMSTKMAHFITNANHLQALELIQMIHDENLTKRSLPAHLLNFLLSDLRNTLIKIRFSVTVPDQPTALLLKELDLLFDEPLTFQLCESITLKLCEIYALHRESNDLISNISNYIRQNFSDPSMGLSKLSDEFHISESYFSHLFKENMGINFSVYLEDLRLTEAIRLIRESSCNISDLYLEVGYNNASTFRRAFKKKFGVTPSSIKK